MDHAQRRRKVLWDPTQRREGCGNLQGKVSQIRAQILPCFHAEPGCENERSKRPRGETVWGQPENDHVCACVLLFNQNKNLRAAFWNSSISRWQDSARDKIVTVIHGVDSRVAFFSSGSLCVFISRSCLCNTHTRSHLVSLQGHMEQIFAGLRNLPCTRVTVVRSNPDPQMILTQKN